MTEFYRLQILSSAIENKSTSVSADGTQNIPPSAIPSRCVPFEKTYYNLKRLTISFSGLLLIGLLFEWWLLYFSGLNIAGHIPYTPIDVGGLLLIGLLVTILIVFIKKLVRQDAAISIARLTLAGTTICLIAENIFQLVQLLTESEEPLKYRFIDFLIGVIGITFFGAIISFFVAFQTKTKRTGLLMLFILAFMVFVVFLRTLLPPTLD